MTSSKPSSIEANVSRALVDQLNEWVEHEIHAQQRKVKDMSSEDALKVLSIAHGMRAVVLKLGSVHINQQPTPPKETDNGRSGKRRGSRWGTA